MRLIDADLLGLSDMEIVMCDGDYKEALKMLIDKIERAPTIDPQRTGKWIPCSSQLPELDVYVIATTQWYEITMACRIDDGEWFIHEDNANAYDDDILAWMPLPEPYRP